MSAFSGGSGSGVARSVAMSRPVGWWPRVVVLLGVLLAAIGAIIALVHPAMLVSPHDEINGAVHIYAGYLAALGNLVAIVGLIQLLDAVMDVAEGRWPAAAGVLVFGVVFLIAAAQISGAPFWKVVAWK